MSVKHQIRIISIHPDSSGTGGSFRESYIQLDGDEGSDFIQKLTQSIKFVSVHCKESIQSLRDAPKLGPSMLDHSKILGANIDLQRCK
jgi:hypothetical protein